MSTSLSASASGSFRPGVRKASNAYSSPLYLTVTRSAPCSGFSSQLFGDGTALAFHSEKYLSINLIVLPASMSPEITMAMLPGT